MSVMRAEIEATPELLLHTLSANKKAAAELAEQIKKSALSPIFLAARGSSANAGLYFEYLCESLAGLPVCKLKPSVLTLMNAALDMRGAVLLTVSQGGRGSDIAYIADRAEEQGVYIACACNDEKSPLALKADALLPLSVGEELSMAATKTFTAELLVMGMLALALAGHGTDTFDEAPALFAKTLTLADKIDTLCEDFRADSSCFVLARGLELPIAQEICCKLQESCYINATPYSAAEFMHGPLALVEEGTRVILFHRGDETGDSTASLYKRLEAVGARTTVFTDSEEFAGNCESALLLPNGGRLLAPFAFTAASQLFACILAEKRGINADLSRGISKYTKTI